MTTTEHNNRDELEKLIDKALKKVQGSTENDLCKYLPGSSGGYMHHFTLRKLKHADPAYLLSLLKKCVLENEAPRILDPKQRAPRGSRKQNDFISFSRSDIEKVLELAKQVGDKDLMTRFSPRRSLPALKRDLIRSIRDNSVNQDLWLTYSELLTTPAKD